MLIVSAKRHYSSVSVAALSAEADAQCKRLVAQGTCKHDGSNFNGVALRAQTASENQSATHSHEMQVAGSMNLICRSREAISELERAARASSALLERSRELISKVDEHLKTSF